MLVKSISVKNYRSITQTRELSLANLSILIGPNNEGKSNIVQALVLAMKVMTDSRLALYFRHGYRSQYLTRGGRNHYARGRDKQDSMSYNWERDFPIKLQKNQPEGFSMLSIDFSLNKREKLNLRRAMKIGIEGELRISISLGRTKLDVNIYDTANLKKKVAIEHFKTISAFLNKNLSVQYIGAIRTADTTTQIVRNMVTSELEKVTETSEYKKTVSKLRRLQEPILRELSKNLTSSVSRFLPDIRQIEIRQEASEYDISGDTCDVTIDDGTKTDLELKGDGIKSLLAISIIQYVARQNSLGRNILLAIEEPESHLHPDAVHRLKKVLDEISSKNQVIITTHSPLLASRANPRKNILVNKSEAKEAETIGEVRNLLGVQIGDNLHSASLIILVEGNEDTKILRSWLSAKSKLVKKAIEDGVIVFDDLAGGANLSYKTSLYKNLLCDVFAFMDGDDAGRKAYELAQRNGLILEKEICFAQIRGMKESEIEDLVVVDAYKEKISQEFNVKLEGGIFRNNKKKWSDRIKETFESQGKNWSPEMEQKIKSIVAERVQEMGLSSLKKTSLSILDSTARFLEEHLRSSSL